MRRWLTRRHNARAWNAKWGERAPRPEWLEEGPRQHVRDARVSGWIVPNATVLDLGCGIGHTAAWLASLGHEVRAVDVSSVAIDRARALHGDVDGLRFECADVGQPLRVDQVYDVVLDLGCLHQLRRPATVQFGANVRRLTRPGSRVLSLFRLWRPDDGETPESKAATVGHILGPEFALRGMRRTSLAASDVPTPRPGVELRFERR